MARTEYGTTWWGQKWLEALNGMDYSGRLPRGKSYANTGKVLSFTIDENKGLIKAKVAGHYEPFYRIKISLPPITEQQHKKLIAEINKSPLVLAKLTARQLDPSVLTICDKLHIKLFPKSWQDLDLSCSCPDYAVPCKHIAAVIYKISQEIDANPFVLFKLRGIDLISDLQKNGLSIERATHAELPTWKELIHTEKTIPDGIEPESWEVYTPQGRQEWLRNISNLSYTQINFDPESIVKILSPAPAGYVHGDLREFVRKVLNKASKLASEQIKNTSERTPPSYHGEHAMLCVNTWGQTIAEEGLSWKEFDPYKGGLVDRSIGALRHDGTQVALHEMFSGYINPERLADSSEFIEALYNAWLIASKLTVASAVIPRIYEPTEECFTVDWIPATSNLEIQKLTILLGNLLEGIPSYYVDILDRPEYFSPQTLGEIFLGMFIQSYIKAAYEELMSEREPLLEQDALFAGQFIDCEDDKTLQATRLRLTDWLSALTIARVNLLPVLTVKDLENPGAKARSAIDAFGRAVSIELGFEIPSEKEDDVAPYFSFGQFLRDSELSDLKFDAMRASAKLSDYCPELSKILEDASVRTSLTMEQLTPLMFNSLPALSMLGVKVILPSSLKHLLTPQMSLNMDIEQDWDKSTGLMGLASLLDFNWQIAIGKNTLTAQEFARISGNAGQIVKFHNEFVYVDPKQISDIQRKLRSKGTPPSRGALIRGLLTGQLDKTTVLLSDSVKKSLAELFEEKRIDTPKSLNANLRHYQERGYQWLMRNMQIGVGSILADDMGLGKTIQVLTFLDKLRENGLLTKKPGLIVVPTSLLANWQREATKFTPKLKVQLYYGQSRDFDPQKTHVVLTTYGTLRRDTSLQKQKYSVLIIDEAQAIKNHKTSTFKTVKNIKADHCVAMSGTPVENRLLEYWSIMEAVNPGLLGSETGFKKEFADPIEVRHDLPSAERFKQLTAPFILRRLKSDKKIISDLPDKISIDEFCTLTPEQVALYKETVDRAMDKLNAGLQDFARRALVLQLITQLKQICNAPLQYEKNSPYKEPHYSGKMERLFEILDNVISSGKKALIFTQFKEMGILLQKWIGERYNKKPNFIHGGVGVKRRQEIVDSFQTDRSDKLLILSLKAAGTGLNLTAASAVIHYDLWWNPAVEAQATDRAYRIGQKDNVTAYRLISADTFEEKINALIESKKALAEMTVATGEHWLTDLTDKQLNEIFTINKKLTEAD